MEGGLTEPDTTTMTGAEFQRHVGTDPQKWAEAFWREFDLRGDRAYLAATVLLLANWFSHFAEVKIAEALRGETDSACQRTSWGAARPAGAVHAQHRRAERTWSA